MHITPAAQARGVAIAKELSGFAAQIRATTLTDYYHVRESRNEANALLKLVSGAAGAAATELKSLGFPREAVNAAQQAADMLAPTRSTPMTQPWLGVHASKLQIRANIINGAATAQPGAAAQAPISLAPTRASYW